MYSLYTIVYGLATVLMLPFDYMKRPPATRSRWVSEKLGRIKVSADKPHLWIHAVSVGEVKAASPLIKRLLKDHPHYHIILSTVTDTGQQVARQLFEDKITLCYLPFDLPFCVEKLLRSCEIKALLIIETELWPNLIKTAKKMSIPVALINGRISERSFKGYRLLSFLMKKLLNQIDILCMQNNYYLNRILALGADPKKTLVMGNLKFDVQIDSVPPAWTQLLKGKVIVAGSTHRPEEQTVIEAFRECLKNHPESTLIIAPRHPERFNEVEELMKRHNLPYVRSSELNQGSVVENFRYVLLDAVGVLASVYQVCDIAIIGGSFIPHGGQNPLEPAYWGKPIVCGPHMHNFPFTEELIKKGAVTMVEAKELAGCLNRFLSDKELAQRSGQVARSFVETHRGATERAINAIRGITEKA